MGLTVDTTVAISHPCTSARYLTTYTHTCIASNYKKPCSQHTSSAKQTPRAKE